jgi:hypothetical protein
MLDDDGDDDCQPLPYRPLYPWRELGTFVATMLVLIWCLWGFARYVWGYFFG